MFKACGLGIAKCSATTHFVHANNTCPTMSNPLILSRQTTCRLRAMLPFVIQISPLGSTHSIPGASFTLTLQRRPQYYMLNIIIPTIVLAALSALNFAVPVDSGEKLSLGISILLAFSVFMLILQDNTPQADTPVLGEYIRVQWTVVDMLIYPSEKKRLCSKARWRSVGHLVVVFCTQHQKPHVIDMKNSLSSGIANLTHPCRETQIYDNKGHQWFRQWRSPVRRNAIIWTISVLLLIERLWLS